MAEHLALANFCIVLITAIYAIVKVRAAVDYVLQELKDMNKMLMQHDRKLIEMSVTCAMRHGGHSPTEELSPKESGA